MQSAYDGALAFDGFAHAFELAGMGVAPGLVDQQLAFFGVGLLELYAFGLGHFDQFDASGLQQLAVGGVGDGFFLHVGVTNDLQSSFLEISFKESAPSMVRVKSFPSLMYSLTAQILSSYENMNYLHLGQVIGLTPRWSVFGRRQQAEA